MKKMKTVILAGGLGTRLRPLTFSIPKPLLPVGKRPILEVIIGRLKKLGLKDIILSVGYGSDMVKSYFGDGSKFGVIIKYVEENKRLGTAGPLKLVQRFLDKSETILLMNGDILTKTNFNKMIKYHSDNKADLTIGIKDYKYRLPHGVLKLDGKKVRNIQEKPALKFKISVGIYVLNSELISLIPSNKIMGMPDLAKILIKNKKKVISFSINGCWFAIDKFEHINAANEGKIQWI